MSPSLRPGLVALVLWALPAPLAAQQRPLADVVPERPIKMLTRAELDRVEAVKLYGRAAQHEHKNELAEALRTYEKALRLDPLSTAVRRALVPLYLALDRQQDALDCCRRVVELDPADFDTWYLYARHLRALDRDDDARRALVRAMQCKALKDKPDVHLAIAYDLGALHEKAGALDKAESAFREAAALLDQPGLLAAEGGLTKEDLAVQAAETHERIGRICLKAKRTDRAVEAFKAAQARDPGRASRLSLNLAEVLAAQGNHAEALRYVDHYLGRQPQGTEGYELKVKLLADTGRKGEVLPALERYSRLDQHNESLRLLLAGEYRKAGRLAEAERLYLGMLASVKVEAYRGLFAVYKDQEAAGLGKLLDRLNRAIAAASPEDEKKVADGVQAEHARAMLVVLREDAALVKALLPAAHERILKGSPPSFRLRLLLGVLAERTGQLDVAERLYRSCLDGDGRVAQQPGRRQAEHEVYVGLLHVLMRQRKYKEVVGLCRKGLEHAEATNRVVFHVDLASAQMALGQEKEALEAIGAAVDVSSARERLRCRCLKARLLAQAGRFRDAEAEGKALLREHSDPAEVQDVRFLLSEVYSLARELDKAEAQLEKVLEADPANARANNDLGYIWADRNKNLAEAERMIRKALSLDRQQRKGAEALSVDADRDNAAYVDSLGWVLFRRGRIEAAREQLEKAAALPDGAEDPVVWDHLGDVAFRLKDDRRAADSWRKALKLYDAGHRRKVDGRYEDIEEKLELLD